MLELLPNGAYAAGIGGGGGVGGVHALNGPSHTGTLSEAQAPWVSVNIAAAIAIHAATAHHVRLHNVVDTLDHSITGNFLDVLGATSLNTIGLITPSANPGIASAILRTDVAGMLSLVKLKTPLIGSDLNLNLQPDLDLYLAPLSNVVRVIENRLVQTDDFQSQLRGWRITYPGEGDFRYIYADQLKVKVFIVDITMALAGSQIITKSVTTLSRDFVVPLPGQAVFLYVDDLPSAEDMAVFEVNDFVRLREFSRAGGGLSVTDCWGIVTGYTNLPDKEQRWTYTRFGTSNSILQVAPRQVIYNNSIGIIIDKEASTLPGHLMLAFISLNRNTTITPPSGWGLIDRKNTTYISAAVYYKIAGASEPADYTWAFGTVGRNQITTYLYSGVKADVVYGESHGFVGGSNIIVYPSINAVTSSDKVMLFAALYNNFEDLTVNTPAGFTELIDLWYNGMVMWSADKTLSSSGPTGTTIAVIDGSGDFIGFNINLVPNYTLNLTTGYSTPGTVIGKESIVLDYGVSGNGWVETTTVDGHYGSNSPYIRVVNWTVHPATGAFVRTLMGNLKGLFGAGVNEYGFYAGNGTGNSDSWFKASSNEVRLNNVPLRLHNNLGQQTVQIGQFGNDIWIGPNVADKRLIWNGTTLTVRGQIIITGGSGYAALTDKPTSLEDINPTQFSHLDSIEANATSGAEWGINLDSIPGRFGNAPTVSGLYLTPTHMGFYNATAGAWKAWIASNGFFYFGGNSGAHLQWNGERLRGIGTDGTTEQWGANSLDGKLYAGAGKVWLDSSGVNLAMQPATTSPSYVRFINQVSGSMVGGLGYYFQNGMAPGVNDGLILYAQPAHKIRFVGANVAEFQNSVKVGTFIDVAAGGYFGGSLTVEGGVLEATEGVANVRLGTSGSPRMLLDSGTTVWMVDNFSDSFRIFKSGDVKLAINNAGTLNVNGTLGESWSGLNFGTGWVNHGLGWTTGQVKKFGDMVFVRGLVFRSSGVGTLIATLPVGYRPSSTIMFHSMSNDVICRMDVNSSGQISYTSGGSPGVWIWLNHSFSVGA